MRTYLERIHRVSTSLVEGGVTEREIDERRSEALRERSSLELEERRASREV